MRNFLAALGVLFFGTIAHAEIYRWVDENGRKHFSDKPPASVQKFDVYGSRGTSAQDTTGNKKEIPNEPTKRASTSISAEDYTITPKLRQQGQELIFTGTVANGPECKRLKLDLYVRTEDGGKTYATTVVENVGGSGAQNFETRVSPWPPSRNPWELSNIVAICE